MIYFVDPVAEHKGSLSKLEDFLDLLREKSRQNYIPSKFVAVDEYLSLWKGRLRFKVYIPNKRERYGVKVYMLCESETGYLSNFIVYTGEDMKYPEPSVTLPEPFEHYGNPSKVVLSLLEGFYNKGYQLALDNLYTSPELSYALYHNGTDAYGTLRKKKGLPKDFWSWKPIKGLNTPPMRVVCSLCVVGTMHTKQSQIK